MKIWIPSFGICWIRYYTVQELINVLPKLVRDCMLISASLYVKVHVHILYLYCSHPTTRISRYFIYGDFYVIRYLYSFSSKKARQLKRAENEYKFTICNYRGSPVSTVFWSMRFCTIRGITLIGNWIQMSKSTFFNINWWKTLLFKNQK